MAAVGVKKKAFAFRIDEKQLATLRKMGVDPNQVVRNAIARAIHINKGKCPTCGRKIATDTELL